MISVAKVNIKFELGKEKQKIMLFGIKYLLSCNERELNKY